MLEKKLAVSLLLATVFVVVIGFIKFYSIPNQEDAMSKEGSTPPEQVDHIAIIAKKFEISRSDATSEVQSLFQAVTGGMGTEVTQDFIEQLEDASPSTFVSETTFDLKRIAQTLVPVTMTPIELFLSSLQAEDASVTLPNCDTVFHLEKEKVMTVNSTNCIHRNEAN